MTRKCNKCRKLRSISEYKKDNSKKDGLRTICNVCDIKRYRSKDGVVATIYGSQKRTSKRRGHRPPEYTKSELKEWMYSQSKFHKIFNEWKNSGYITRLKPSVDRIYDEIHYCMSNIQIMTWGENDDKENNSTRTGKKITLHKSVSQFTKDYMYISEYFSISEASRQTGVYASHITRCCKGKIKSAGGYIWRYNV